MKLATLRNGRPDGHLVIVSRDLSRVVSAGRIASTLQAALDEWSRCAPILRTVSDQLNRGEIGGMPFEPGECLAPLPRAYQWIDAASYALHRDRVGAPGGSETAGPSRPLLYQGASDSLVGPAEPIGVPEPDLALDYEAELAVVIGPVPMRPDRETALDAIRLVGLCSDTSLRRLVAEDLESGFGFFHAKPATSFAPVLATPDELGPAWREARAHVKVRIEVNGSLYGRLDAGADMKFDFADLIMAAARTRRLGTGTIVGSGAIANANADQEALPLKRDQPGFGCIAEARALEKLKFGKARTAFLKPGDRLFLEARDGDASLFGAIDQRVTLARNETDAALTST